MENRLDPKTWQQRRSGTTKGRLNDTRSQYDRDRARIIHSAAFRRLQAKTQVFGLGHSDFYRTRLTHTMEVAQIARGIVQHLCSIDPANKKFLPPLDVIEAIAFAHDLGHPPFGHGGEVALNYAMREFGGFEGNGQSLRLIARIEPHTDGYGIDPTRRTQLGILKYPRPYSEARRRKLPRRASRFTQVKASEWKPPKCYLDSERDVVDWILAPFTAEDRDEFVRWDPESVPTDTANGKTLYKALDTTIMELADDIAYGVHDFEDAVALDLMDERMGHLIFDDIDKEWAKTVAIHPNTLLAELFLPSNEGGNRKRAIGTLVHALISSITLVARGRFASPHLELKATLSAPAGKLLSAMQKAFETYVIGHSSVRTEAAFSPSRCLTH